MRFLKENWVWIVAPIVVFVALVAWLYFTGEGGFSDGDGYDLR